MNSWISRLPEASFPADQYTDEPERFLTAEVVREKAILVTREEVPHAIAVTVDSFEEADKLLRIRPTIYVEHEGQKGILIGKCGETIKKIGTQARQGLEAMLGAHISLELNVSVRPNWRQSSSVVRQLDWRRQLEQWQNGRIRTARIFDQQATTLRTPRHSSALARLPIP